MNIDRLEERALPEERMAARRALLEEHVRRTAGRWPRRRVVARWAVIGVGASALLVVGTAGAYVAFKPATVPIADGTRCYSRASLEGGDRGFWGTTAAQAFPAGGGERAAVGAVEVCASLWRQGVLRLNTKQVGFEDTANGVDHTVPPLVACTLDNGMAAVFPGDEQTCARLGLPRLAE